MNKTAHTATRELAGALRRQAARVGQSGPVRGAAWRMATVATVDAGGTITTTDGITARRLRSYINPAVGDLVRIDSAPGGSWTCPGPLSSVSGDPPWASYSSVWTASTTAPSLGNGALTGLYTLLGKTCHVAIRLVPGSTTSVGAGTYTFTVPFLSANAVAEYLGTARLTSGSTYIGQVVLGPNSNLLNATFPASSTPATAANMSAAAPAAFASGHILRMALTYQIA